jgi:twitching motility protein PilT
MKIEKILQNAIEKKASDIFVIAGFPLAYKINGDLVTQNDLKLKQEETKEFAEAIYRLRYGLKAKLNFECQIDFSFSIVKIGRFRVNIYYQRGSIAAVLRPVRFDVLNYKKSGIIDEVMDLSKIKVGLVLITGTAGSGKSTTMACIIDRINHNYSKHIITIEDPIEYLHSHDKCIVSQREIESDVKSYGSALVAALREAPDVIQVGEMRDLETIRTSLSAVETGHVVFSTLHTIGASDTINRIIDVFSSNQQHQIELQLASSLQAVVSQKLIKSINGDLIPVFEILKVNKAIKTLIREGKAYQIDNYITGGRNEGMISLDDSIMNLYLAKKIEKEVAISAAKDPLRMKQLLD